MPATTPACPNITLTTDFGLAEPFVGMMKGVIAGICPQARVIDITHGVEPFHILDGAVKLWQAARYFPAGTIHVAVVDPGVGSERRALLARIGEQWFIAPDNGLLSWVVGNAAADVEVWLLETRPIFCPAPAIRFTDAISSRLVPRIWPAASLPGISATQFSRPHWCGCRTCRSTSGRIVPWRVASWSLIALAIC